MAKAKKSDAKSTAKPVKRVVKRTGRAAPTKAAASNAQDRSNNLAVVEHARAAAHAVEALRRSADATLADLHDALQAELRDVQNALGAVEELIETAGEDCALADLKKA